MIARVRRALSKSRVLKSAYHTSRLFLMAAACDLSPALLCRLRYRIAWGRFPDLTSPKTFDEKLLWLNLKWRDPLKVRCADKYALRGFAEEQQFGHLLPALYGLYSSTGEIRVADLPDRFVLKCTHGCKCNVFCRDKRHFNWPKARRDLELWLKQDYSRPLGEVHYRSIPPRIICEEFLDDGTSEDLPRDYKVFCFDGHAHCTMTTTQRIANDTAKLAFYDLLWQRRLPYILPELAADPEIPRPAAYDAIIDAAQRLSRPFPFVRMDFYSVRGKAVLGEMTFTPGACVSADYLTRQAQDELGRLIHLPTEA